MLLGYLIRFIHLIQFDRIINQFISGFSCDLRLGCTIGFNLTPALTIVLNITLALTQTQTLILTLITAHLGDLLRLPITLEHEYELQNLIDLTSYLTLTITLILTLTLTLTLIVA